MNFGRDPDVPTRPGAPEGAWSAISIARRCEQFIEWIVVAQNYAQRIAVADEHGGQQAAVNELQHHYIALREKIDEAALELLGNAKLTTAAELLQLTAAGESYAKLLFESGTEKIFAMLLANLHRAQIDLFGSELGE